jgi:putative acetyltransferase
MSEPYTIRAETPEDHKAIVDLQLAAFEGEDVIPRLITDLRESAGAFPTVSLVAVTEAGLPVGHVMMSHAWLDSPKRMIDVMVLSPLGVLPMHQETGIGTALINAALERAEALCTPLVFVEGNPNFYRSRGFEKAMDLGFRRPSVRIPEGAFQVAKMSTYKSDMTGTFVYRDVHWRHGVGLCRD